jgi:hypothetical protein
MGLLGFPAKENIVSAEKCCACTARSIYLTFGYWGVPDAFDISNIRTLKVKHTELRFSKRLIRYKVRAYQQ